MTDLPFLDTEEIVDEDGVIESVPVGEESLGMIAVRALEATEQEKLWDARKKHFNGLLAQRQIDSKAVYGEVQVSTSNATKLDRPRLRSLIEDIGLSEDEVYQLLFAATQFATDELPVDLQAIVRRAYVPGARYAKTSRVRRLAPVEVSDGNS